MCAALLLAADAQLFFFVVEPPVVAALAFFSSASRSPLVDIRSASSRSFFRHSEFSIFSVRSDPIHIAISIQVVVFAQALESMCGNIANMNATGTSIDFKGGIHVGMSERMNAAILERGWSTKRLAAQRGTRTLSHVSRQFVTTFGINIQLRAARARARAAPRVHSDWRYSNKNEFHPRWTPFNRTCSTSLD